MKAIESAITNLETQYVDNIKTIVLMLLKKTPKNEVHNYTCSYPGKIKV